MLTTTGFCTVVLLQAGGATLRGVVRDGATDAPLAGARVELPAAGCRTVTDSAGRYAFPGVAPGAQRVRTLAAGYEPQSLAVLLPPFGELRVDLSLTPAPALLAGVRVFGRRPPDSAPNAPPDASRGSDGFGSRSFDRDAVRATPALAEPDAVLALGTLPEVGVAPEAPTALHVRGGAGDQTLVLVDGVPLYSPLHASGAFGALNPDALDAITLYAGVPPARLGGALSGVVDARVRAPDARHPTAQAAVSLSSARLTLDAPWQGTGAGALLSARLGRPSLLASPHDPSRLHATSTDLLAKLSAPFAGAALELLGAATCDHADFAADPYAGDDERPPTSAGPPAPPSADRHRLAWQGRSAGLTWRQAVGARAHATARVWRADLATDLRWVGDSASWAVASTRVSTGQHAAVTFAHRTGTLEVGEDFLDDRVDYAARSDPRGTAQTPTVPASAYQVRSRAHAVWTYADHDLHLGDRWQLLTGLRAGWTRGLRPALEPRLAARYTPTPWLAVGGGVGRVYQQVQSLRNPESPVRNIFGGDLAVGAGPNGAPTARSDQVTAAVEVRPTPTLRLRVDAYTRRMLGLVLVAPVTDLPFATGTYAVGSGRAAGLALTADHAGERMPITAALGVGRVTLSADTLRYHPGDLPSVTLLLGAAYRASAHTTLRGALVAEAGRHTTAVAGPVAWQACNVLEGGCDVAGTPRTSGLAGGARLPTYLRVDVGARRAWRTGHPGRPGRGGGAPHLEAYATLSNLFDRRNTWAVGEEARPGGRRGLSMRPRSLLAAGVEWHR